MFAGSDLRNMAAPSVLGLFRFISMRSALLVALAVVVLARFGALLAQFGQAVPAAFVFDEDAYYVFSVARNVAHGHGITADGIQWTNGFQPLWTLIVTLPYLVADDRTPLAFIGLLSATLWVVSALLFARLIVRLTRLHDVSWPSTALAVLFLADLQLQTAYFNGLETGLYLTVVLALLVWTTHDAFLVRIESFRLAVAFGAGLGLLILARNDGVFFAFALLAGVLTLRRTLRALRAVCVAAGAIAAITLPWLGYNAWLTGSLVPQSGAATNAGPYRGTSLVEKLGQMVGRLAQLTFTPFPFNYAGVQRLSAPVAGFLALSAMVLVVILLSRRDPRILAAIGRCYRLRWPRAVCARTTSSPAERCGCTTAT